jgi:hypothetical protein
VTVGSHRNAVAVIDEGLGPAGAGTSGVASVSERVAGPEARYVGFFFFAASAGMTERAVTTQTVATKAERNLQLMQAASNKSPAEAGVASLMVAGKPAFNVWSCR